MKKITLLSAIAMLCFFTACKKEDNPAAADAGSWTLGTTTYQVAYSGKTQLSGSTTNTLYIFSDVVLQGSNPQAHTLNLTFTAPPTVSGTYQLVSSASSGITGSQVQVSAGSQSGTYAYIGTGAVNVEVTVTGGKIKAVIPQVTMTSTSGQPNVTLSAAVREK